MFQDFKCFDNYVKSILCIFIKPAKNMTVQCQLFVGVRGWVSHTQHPLTQSNTEFIPMLCQLNFELIFYVTEAKI